MWRDRESIGCISAHQLYTWGKGLTETPTLVYKQFYNNPRAAKSLLKFRQHMW